MSAESPIAARVVRRIGAAPERVFEAWIDPAVIGRWMFGPAVRDEEVVSLSTDPRVGGAFSFVVLRDGEVIDHVGKYREIVRPALLVFTWGVAGESDGESEVIVEIRPSGTGSELTLTHEMAPRWLEFVGRSEAAWRKMLDALGAALA